MHLHWVAGLLDHRAFFAALGANRPLVWTLHDMGPFTGGCHYAGECERFTRRCGRCPQLGSSSERDLSRRIWERKAEALAGLESRHVRVVSPSHWLAEEARRSALLGRFDVEVVPHGLDPAAVRPRDRSAARAALGIEADAAVVMFAAVGVHVPRKGMRELATALRSLRDLSGLQLLVVGGGAPPELANLPVRELGYVGDMQRMVEAYSAADVFAMPSLSEAFGLTALEAQACACPVVGFDTGGIGDIVCSGSTGELVPRADIGALTDALRAVLEDPRRARAMGRAGRERVQASFTLAQQASAYRAVYDALSPGSGHGGHG